jgi:hypothetical protein
VAARDPDQLPSDSIVIRGGRMSAQTLKDSAEVARRKLGEPSLSFWSFTGMTAEEVAAEVERLNRRNEPPAVIPHPVIRAARAGQLFDAGYRLKRSGSRRGHYSLTFSQAPTDADWKKLDEIFGPPEPNPVAL